MKMRVVGTFLVAILVGFLVEAAVLWGFDVLQNDAVQKILLSWGDFVVNHAIWLINGIVLPLLIGVIVLLDNSANLCYTGNLQNMMIFAQAERWITLAAVLLTVLPILFCLLITFLVAICHKMEYLYFIGGISSPIAMVASDLPLAWWCLWGIAEAIGGIFLSSCLQIRVNNLTKQLYPHQQGHWLDKRFSKYWQVINDAEKQTPITRAGYWSFAIMRRLFPVVWLVVLVIMIIFDTGLFPVILVILLWFVQTLSYALAGLKK